MAKRKKFAYDFPPELYEEFRAWATKYSKKPGVTAIAAVRLFLAAPERLQDHVVMGRFAEMKEWFRMAEQAVGRISASAADHEAETKSPRAKRKSGGGKSE